MSSIFTDPIPFTCDETYNTFTEILKYFGTVFYLGIGLILHVWLLRTILITGKGNFKESSFFQIHVMDSIASIVIILCDILFNRLFMYVPPLCPIIGPLFWNPSYICKIVYITGNHARFSKSVCQIFMVLNRMSCVLSPVSYNQVWKKVLPLVQTLIVVLPFGGTWNIWISRVYVNEQFGGFGLIYKRHVSWAALSLFQSIYILTAFAFTVICTSITLYKLLVLPERIKTAEKSLCFTSMFISITFLLVATTQILWTTCCNSEILYSIQFYAFDTFTVGSAVIVIIVNKQLRSSIAPWGASERSRTNVVLVSS